MVVLCFALPLSYAAAAIDLVINVTSDKPAYKSTDTQYFTVTVSNNGPGTATNSALTVNHPAAGPPFDLSGACTASGGAICPASYAGLPTNNFTATIPSIPSQGKVVITFQVVPVLVCRRQDPSGGTGPSGPCPFPLTYDIGRKLITAFVTNTAADGLPITNVANTNIVLYGPTVGYKVDITSSPTGPLTPGLSYTYDFTVTSQGADPSGPLKLSVFPESQPGTPTPAASFTSFLPGTQITSLTCLSAVPASGAALPSTVFVTGTCASAIPVPVPGPTTLGSNTLQGFPNADFVAIPGTDIQAGGGVVTFRAVVKIGQPLCTIAGATTRPLDFKVSVSGPAETAPTFTGADNLAVVSNNVNASCLEADIESTITALPSPVSATTPGSNTYTITSVIKNISTGAGAGTATNVPFTISTGQNPFFLGPISLTAPICTLAGGAVCPASYNVTPVVASTQKTITGVIPSLPSNGSVTISAVVTTGSTAPLCNFTSGTTVMPYVEALPDSLLADPNYNNVLPAWGNNRNETVIVINATGSNNAAPACSSGPPSASSVTVVKSGPFTSAGGPTTTGQSAGAFVAPGTMVWYRVVVTNIGAVSVDLKQLQDTNSGPTTALSTGGFQGSGTSLAGWGVLCTPSGGATCFNAVTTTPAGYQPSLALGYTGGVTQPLAGGATVTLDLPYIVPAPALFTPGVCTAQFTNSAFATFDVGGVGSSAAAVASPFIYTGYSSCATNLTITKTVNAPATTSFIPPSGIVSYSVVLANPSATQISRPRFQDLPQLNVPGSATLTTVSVSCVTTSGGALCPPAGSLVVGTQMPSATPIAPNAIDIEWGATSAPTMPTNSSVTFTVTLALTVPRESFNGVTNTATFRADNEPLFWASKQSAVSIFVPLAPIVSVQKRVATQIVAAGGIANYTVDVINVGGSSATNVVFIDNIAASLMAANPGGYAAVTCTNISATMPAPQGTVTCPTPSGTAAGLNFTIPALPQNTALRFTYQAQMPTTALSAENFVSVTPQSSPGVTSFSAGAAGAHANVQVLAAVVAEVPVVTVPTLELRSLLALVCAILAVAGIVFVRRRPRRLQ